MANACVFCGDDSRRLSDEHVFGDWISRFFVEELGVQITGTSELVGSDGTTRIFPMKPFQQKTKIVCRRCNETWMSKLETSVMDDLKIMIRGQPKMLRSAAQQRLAFWCAKTALVLDHLHPQDRVIPDSHYRDLYSLKSALPSQVVLLAFRSVTNEPPGELLASVLKQPVVNLTIPADSPPSFREKIQEYASDGHRAYKITFAVGNFAALVFGHNFPMPMNVNSPKPVARNIWPIARRFKWSEELSVDKIGGLPGFHARFGPSQDETALLESVPAPSNPRPGLTRRVSGA
jgi:hypothetical protein